MLPLDKLHYQGDQRSALETRVGALHASVEFLLMIRQIEQMGGENQAVLAKLRRQVHFLANRDQEESEAVWFYDRNSQ